MEVVSQAAMTTDRPLVSICIANYNGESFLAECIDSILNQWDAPVYEIIVHDDASTDRSLELLSRYPMVTVIRSEKNVGFCTSNNRMTNVAKGIYLLLLNNDAVLYPDALSTLATSVATIGTPTILGLRQYDYYSHRLIDTGAQLDIFMSPVPITQNNPARPAMVIGACLWIPRSLWNELGGFPEWFETNAEDVYLCCAARLRGYDIQVPMYSGYLHRVGATLSDRNDSSNQLSTTVRRRYLSERNRTRLMLLFYPLWLLIPSFFLHLITLLIEGSIVSLANMNPKILKYVYWNAIRDVGFKDTMARRTKIRKSMTHEPATMDFLSRFCIIPEKLRNLILNGLPHVR